MRIQFIDSSDLIWECYADSTWDWSIVGAKYLVFYGLNWEVAVSIRSADLGLYPFKSVMCRLCFSCIWIIIGTPVFIVGSLSYKYFSMSFCCLLPGASYFGILLIEFLGLSTALL